MPGNPKSARDIKPGQVLRGAEGVRLKVAEVGPGPATMSHPGSPNKRGILVSYACGAWDLFHPDEELPNA